MEKPFGKYLLLGRLGGGGMAEVFRARLTGFEGFEKLVALKLILRSYSSDTEFVRMFVQEASLSARLDHANIVRVYEFDQINNCYYIAMELVDGQDLHKVLLRCRELTRALSVPETLVIALEICKGLAFAHGELRPGAPEIVHRDISPHNIILSRAGEVKITDFGIAKLASAASRTKTGLIKGKAGYMSPEQARGEPVDRRSDLFALGCILWEMLAGRRLFTGANDQAVLYNFHTMQIPPVSFYNTEAGEDIDQLLAGLLQRDPEQRINSATDVLTTIDRILQGYPNIQRSTLLAELYSVLFSDVSEDSSTNVLPLHQPVAETLSAISDQSTVPYQQRPPINEENLTVIGAQQNTRKGVLTSLVIAATLIAAGFIGYGVWDAFDANALPYPDKQPAADIKAAEAAPPQPIPSPSPSTLPPKTDPPDVSAAESEPGQEPNTAIQQSPPPVRKPATVASQAERPEIKTVAIPPGSGLLQLYSTPPSLVYDGDKLLGQTLLELVLPAGEYTFLLVSVKDNDTTRKVKVTVRPQKTTTNKFVVR